MPSRAFAAAPASLTGDPAPLPVDLTARRMRGEQAVACVAAAPVRHVPVAFLAALQCRSVEDVVADSTTVIAATSPSVALRVLQPGA